jgi:hypothetical protein
MMFVEAYPSDRSPVLKEILRIPSRLMDSQKVVTPAEAGVQEISNYLKKLDSGIRRNHNKPHFQTFYEFIRVNAC